ncbi:receptor-activated Ca2+-permeable cation channel [Lentinula raphanica]|nr:receptor-activated Ca2+-permeable cation channel [Lentinula raphanica]
MDQVHGLFNAPRLLAPSPEYLNSIKVFPLIPAIKKEIIVYSPLSWEQLTASDISFSIVRPIVFKFARLKNLAVVYACLVVRSYFLGESENDLAYAGVNLSRASLCELIAMKLLSHFAANHMQLVAALTTSWNPLAGATSSFVDEVQHVLKCDEEDLNYPQSALEMAISTKSTRFLASPVTQKVVNDIYTGRVVFSIAATRSVLADNYKNRSIQFYDWRDAPLLDHYRLRVPKYGAILEFLNFAILLLTFILCLSNRNPESTNVWELVFILFAVAFALEEYTASTEHGWGIYIANASRSSSSFIMWNVFDTAFLVIFGVYLVLRLRGLVNGDAALSGMAFDILSCGACILLPRLAFFAVSNTVVVLALRAMIAEFVFFIGIASICFSGLLFTLWTLEGKNKWTLKSISWLMVQIWFGNTYLSFGEASSFHPVLGPILMTCFAALSNTLLLTILISILSNTVARIDANITQEYLFQFTISTIEGVKTDALFSYQPPFNILAFLILKPASWIVSPRALHSLNVLLIKLTSFPILLVIGIYERYLAHGRALRESGRGAAHSLFNSLPRQIKNIPIVEALVGSTSADIYEAIFDVEAENDSGLFNDSDDEDVPALRSFQVNDSIPGSPTRTPGRKRLTSLAPSTSALRDPSPLPSPRLRPVSNLELSSSGEVPSPQSKSPLARLFVRTPSDNPNSATAGSMEASLKRFEGLVEEMKSVPLQRMREEVKELQDRQARIENLLLTLTRGMRQSDLDRSH